MRDLKTITILFRTISKVQEAVKENVSAFSINPTEFAVLEVLFHKGDMTAQQVKEKILIASSSLSYVIEQLQIKKYIEKKQCEKDKRVFYLSLSKYGENFMKDMYPKHQKHMRNMLDVLTEREEEKLQELLKKIGKQE